MCGAQYRVTFILPGSQDVKQHIVLCLFFIPPVKAVNHAIVTI